MWTIPPQLLVARWDEKKHELTIIKRTNYCLQQLTEVAVVSELNGLKWTRFYAGVRSSCWLKPVASYILFLLLHSVVVLAQCVRTPVRGARALGVLLRVLSKVSLAVLQYFYFEGSNNLNTKFEVSKEHRKLRQCAKVAGASHNAWIGNNVLPIFSHTLLVQHTRWFHFFIKNCQTIVQHINRVRVAV